MNDGSNHTQVKQAVSATFASLTPATVGEQSNRWARILAANREAKGDGEYMMDIAFRLPIYVLASLLGLPDDKLDETTDWVGEFVCCLSPISSQTQTEQGKVAAGHLLALFHSLLTLPGTPVSTLFNTLAESSPVLSQNLKAPARAGAVANSIGFLSQAYEATAGLIGNTLVALAAYPDMRQQVMTEPALLRPFIEEVLRYDPPIQNTRRFLAGSHTITGQVMNENDAVLVVLAAANRDPSLNPQPAEFNLFRPERRLFTFGVGVHSCPGVSLAVTIAQAGIRQLLATGLDWELLAQPATYRPSVNARIPQWTESSCLPKELLRL
jgi:cytochrome P450